MIAFCVLVYRELLLDPSAVFSIWGDNFSNVMANQFVTIHVGNCRVLLWTAMGVIKAPSTVPLSLSCDLDQDNNPIPSISVDPFVGVDVLKRYLRALDRQGFNYWFDSICVRKNVDNVPPYPDPHNYPVSSKIRNNLEKHINSLADFVPLNILPVNPASNEGSCRLLQHIVVNYENLIQSNSSSDNPHATLPHRIYLSDVNIYPRAIQVCTFQLKFEQSCILFVTTVYMDLCELNLSLHWL